jgi:tetratricopeptide (TPR) repeat protein
MRSIKSFTLLLLLFIFLQFSFSQHQHQSTNNHPVGKINFPITTSKPETQKKFNHALAMLHHMMYDHSEKEFRSIIEGDPQCAMAYWGIAMSYFHPLWHEPTEEDLINGSEAIEKAKSLNPPTPYEQDYIAAIESIYKDWKTVKHQERIVKWEIAQQKLMEKYPDDIDAGAFYSLSLLTTAPKSDKTFSNQKKAGEILEKLLVKAPEHPGLFHYTIHAYDNPQLAPKAVDVARKYDKLAPDVPHALHMPSHIFVRLGMWRDAVDWNIRSAASSLKNSLGNEILKDYPHALDYLMYSYLQLGEDQQSEDIFKKLTAVNNYEDMFQCAYGTAAGQVRYLLERRKWQEAEMLSVRNPGTIQWDKYPYAESIVYFARGLGAARNGNIATAKDALAMLNKLYDRTLEIGQTYWAVTIDVQRITVEAWIAHSEGNEIEALTLMKKAADLEDSVDKHPVTPGAVLPARELLGDMLLFYGKFNEAIDAYKFTLTISPNRFNSLFGLGNAYVQSGDLSNAKKCFVQLMEMTSSSKTNRNEISEASDFLTRN